MAWGLEGSFFLQQEEKSRWTQVSQDPWDLFSTGLGLRQALLHGLCGKTTAWPFFQHSQANDLHYAASIPQGQYHTSKEQKHHQLPAHHTDGIPIPGQATMIWSSQPFKVITTPVDMLWVTVSGNNSPWASAASASCRILSLSASSCSRCAWALISANSFRKLFLHLNPLKTVQKKKLWLEKRCCSCLFNSLREEHWVILLHPVQSPQHLNHVNKEQWKLNCEQAAKTLWELSSTL